MFLPAGGARPGPGPGGWVRPGEPGSGRRPGPGRQVPGPRCVTGGGTRPLRPPPVGGDGQRVPGGALGAKAFPGRAPSRREARAVPGRAPQPRRAGDMPGLCSLPVQALFGGVVAARPT